MDWDKKRIQEFEAMIGWPDIERHNEAYDIFFLEIKYELYGQQHPKRFIYI